MLTYTAFEEFSVLAQGSLEKVALDMRRRFKDNQNAKILLFSDATGKQMDVDLRGSEKDVLERLKVFLSPSEVAASSGPGRPKLGVIAREVSLLPQHWEWLSTQTGGASATIRRLVDAQMKEPLSAKDRVKQTQETTYRFLSAIAGDLPNFEEAIRFLYRKDKKKFKELIASWPKDLVKHTMELADTVFADGK